jgi:hypothetical protein
MPLQLMLAWRGPLVLLRVAEPLAGLLVLV